MNFAGRYPLLLVFASAALAIGVAACGGDSSDEDPTTPAEATNTPAENGNGNDDNGDSEITIEVAMRDNFFDPAEITVPVGEKVTIIARNEGTAIHNMVVLDTEFKSDVMVMSGEESTFEVQFNSPGTYDFQCDYHVPDMVGTITAE